MCMDSGDCIKCFNQYYLDANQGCVACAGNCMKCENQLACEVCDLGYFLDGTLCKQCSRNLTNCLVCLNGMKCLDC
jgi:proprotein convertase subtilisin/kexin type 5